jgi:hypothetical protein
LLSFPFPHREPREAKTRGSMDAESRSVPAKPASQKKWIVIALVIGVIVATAIAVPV